MYRVSFLLLSLMILPLYHSANASEQYQPEKIYIVAEATQYNYKTGETTYDGHVKVDQGNTHLTADRVTTKTDSQHKIREIIAYGLQETAHYWTLLESGHPEAHAHAKIIKFYPDKSSVSLEQDAVVTQGENSFQGQLILYNRADQTVFVPASNTGRAVVVYNPDKK